MATVDETLNTARSFLGEGPQRFTDWYGCSTSTPWCCVFQSFVLSSVGIPTRYAWVSGLFNIYRDQQRTTTNVRAAQPGMLVAFDYDGTGAASFDHIAMVESVRPDGIVAINGNWENRVQRVFHAFDRGGYAGGIAELAMPSYSSTPTPTPSPEDDNMAQAILWDANGTAWHASGNTRVALSSMDQVNVLKFFGVPEINPAHPAWIDSLAIIPRNGGINTPGN